MDRDSEPKPEFPFGGIARFYEVLIGFTKVLIGL